MTRKKKQHDELPVWKKMNIRAELERRLETVVEQANIEAEEADAKESVSVSFRVNREASTNGTMQESRILRLDKKLLEQHGLKKPSKKVVIRKEPHEKSPYEIRFERLARQFETEVRVPIMRGIHAWLAPFSRPPSPDEIASLANDLRVGSLDPRVFMHQFTPGEAHEAYAKSYAWWTHLREPFVRWEHAPSAAMSLPVGRRALVDLDLPEVEPEPDVDPTEDFWQKAKAYTKHAVETFEDYEDELIGQTEAEVGAPMLVPKVVPWRIVTGLVMLLLVVSVPAGAVSVAQKLGASWTVAEEQGRSAFSNLEVALSADEAKRADIWRTISGELEQTDRSLNDVNALAIAVSKAIPQTSRYYEAARKLVYAGEESSRAGELLSKGLVRAMEEPAKYPIERIELFGVYLEEARPRIDAALENLNTIQPKDLPEELQPKMAQAQELLASVNASLTELETIYQFLLPVLGKDHDRRYLLVFQNPSELRPSGGFMGSVADVVVDRGEIKNVFVPGGGPYDLQQQLLARVRPPDPLQLIASRWEFQDANWFADFPTTAEKIKWFWSKAGQPTVDGVIAVNAPVMVDLLKVTGPIEMPEYGKTITAENFVQETQKAVEVEYDKEQNAPKKFIGDLMPLMMEKLKGASNDEWIAYAKVFIDALARKDIQIYMSRADEEKVVEQYDWSGRLKQTPGDSIAVVGANIAGQKTDYVIDEDVHVKTKIDDDGTITNTVTIKRTHNGTKGEPFYGVNNVTYLKLYVPEGSQLLSAEGLNPPPQELFDKIPDDEATDADLERLVTKVSKTKDGVDITKEFGRTAFGAWVQVDVGQTVETTFTYQLPFTVFDLSRRLAKDANQAETTGAAYLMLYTSQSGKPERKLETEIDFPENWEVAWRHLPSEDIVNWDRDYAAGLLFKTHE